MPKVSVIIPTYNRERFILRAINSVFNQTYTDYEIIVIDDGSTDNTLQILDPIKNRIKYFYQKNKGISFARNKGIELSSGQYIAFLDSDDYWDQEKLRLQVNILDTEEKIGLVCSPMLMLNENNEPVGTKPKGKICRNFKELMELKKDIPTSTILTRIECINKVGNFDTNLYIGEDFELCLRILEHYDMYIFENHYLAYYVQHKEQSTKDLIRYYSGLINTDQKILSYFKSPPTHIIKKNIALNEYCLGKEFYNLKDFNSAKTHILKAFRNHFLLGELFLNGNESFTIKIKKFINPFALLLISSLKASYKHSTNL